MIPEPFSDSTPPLTQLYFYLTEGCNLACRHCWLGPRFDPDGTRYGALPLELFEIAVREAKPLGLSRVKLTGGEPLLHPHISKLLEIVRREELGLTIETNGMLCTPAMAAEIAKVPQRSASVSLDGADAATHEWVRGVPGSFEHAAQAVRNLAAENTPPQIIMTLMRINADQVEPLIHLAEKLGASSVKFNILQPTARGEKLHRKDEALDVPEVLALSRKVFTDLAPATRLPLRIDVPPAFRPLSRIAGPDDSGVCGIHSILGVIASGHYALCGIGAHVDQLVFGVVGVDPLDRVWKDNPTLRAIRNGLPGRLGGVCARCVMRSRCLGACIAQNYYRGGSLWAAFWFCEQAALQGLFPESRVIPIAQQVWEKTAAAYEAMSA